ncbi:glycosyl hydrolase, partial [Streptomyces sp. SID5785]|uniref:fibronectin type III-like domain-contianing protein n=1 Tax=Streptomyces sp. SID5785 TaxID=2690309 RepID=UPI00136181EC
LSYTSFEWSDLEGSGRSAATDGAFEIACTVRNTGARPGTEIVQIYLHDPVASVVQPVQRLVAYLRLDELAPGEAVRVRAHVPADLASFTGRGGRRIVEPGDLELRLAASSTRTLLTARVSLTGAVREVDHRRRLHAGMTAEPLPAH